MTTKFLGENHSINELKSGKTNLKVHPASKNSFDIVSGVWKLKMRWILKMMVFTPTQNLNLKSQNEWNYEGSLKTVFYLYD